MSIIQKVKKAAAKRRAKEHFLSLTDHSLYEAEPRELSRRRTAAEKLLELAERGVPDEDIVARRFVKRVTTQQLGVSALLRLSDLECRAEQEDTIFRDNTQTVSSRLLKLVVSYSRDSTFFHDTIPAVLRNRSDGLPAIIALAKSFPDMFNRTDPTIFSGYLRRVTEGADLWSDEWLRSILLLNHWLLSQIAHGEHQEGALTARISTTRWVMNRILPACSPQVSHLEPKKGCYPRGWMLVVQVIISACTLAAKEDSLNDILPSGIPLKSFVDVCVKIVVTSSGPEPSPRQPTACGLALKALAMLRNASEFPQSIPTNEHLQFEEICMTVLLDRTLWKREVIDDRVAELTPGGRRIRYFCKLPKPAFERALAAALSERTRSTSSTDSEHDQAIHLLDPLLWLSNMPPHIVAAHQALVQGGVCVFLTTLITCPVPSGSPIENRSLWRAKGEAMTCLGNIVERMDHKELCRHVTREVIDAVVTIKESMATPLVQKGQAVFMLQRYTIAANRFRITCYHREEPSGSERYMGSQEKTIKLSVVQKVQHAAAKRRAKQHFFLLTYVSSYENESQELSRRKNAAEKLLEIARREVDGEDIVARRFVKRAANQVVGVSALFKLSDLECRAEGGDTIFKDHSQAPSSRLLKLVVSHSRDSTFFHDTLPIILRNGSDGLPAIISIAKSVPDMFNRTDPTVLSTYLLRVTEREEPWTDGWLRGILLLNLWLLSQIAHGEHYNGSILAQISTIRFIMNNILPACTPEVSQMEPMEGYYPRGWMLVFQVIISACTLAAKEDCLGDVLPSGMPLKSFVDLCIKIVVTSSRPEPSPRRPTACGLALKALAMLRHAPEFPESVPTDEHLQFEDVCMTVLLEKTLWRREMVEEQELTRWHSFHPEEDAFDIFCRLPKPTFERALASVLTRRMASTTSTHSEHDRAIYLLDPLLWLSNMPQHIVEAHQALVQGGACDFLASLIVLPIPPGSSTDNRSLWRVKGEAMTCLGNIVERMDYKELSRYITQELIKTVVVIKESTVTPLVQKGQAVFMLQRYTMTADRFRMICYHREEASSSKFPLE
ncbi:hypothetical protein FRC00_003004 [Tulasnella sp. 408]|nr:hypothetical protein FRC00_003004 [Tulasnella sp. 408]